MLRHMELSAYCCFLSDLTRFTVSHCAGPPCSASCLRALYYYIIIIKTCQPMIGTNNKKRRVSTRRFCVLLSMLTFRSYTSSRYTTSALSPDLGPSLRILVYPPLRSSYPGAISSKSFDTTSSSNMYARTCLLA